MSRLSRGAVKLTKGGIKYEKFKREEKAKAPPKAKRRRKARRRV